MLKAAVTIVETEAPIPSRPDVTRLLQDFVSQGSEPSFRRVVEQLQPFVYSTALRRTGDRQMAEDVTQTVFITIARNAAQLRKHPKLMVWISKAIHFTAVKAIRTEQRLRRKHAGFAAETRGTEGHGNDNRWDEVIPHLDASLGALGSTDHELILLRFYEGRKFTEIANRLGSTEAACKMRLKRALEKLSGLLASKGVVVPVAVLASCLAAELAKAAPLTSAARIAALALSPGAAATGFFTTQTLGIMSTAKTASVTTVAVLVLAAIPLSIQARRMGETKAALAHLESRAASLDPAAWSSGRDRPGRKPATVRDLVAAKRGAGDNQAVFGLILQAFMEQDQAGMALGLAFFGTLDAARYAELLAEAREYPGSADARRMLLGILALLAPADSRQGEIDSLLASNHGMAAGKILGRWASEDPEGAIRWFLDKRAKGELVSTAVYDWTEAHMFTLLLNGVLSKDPARAVSLFNELAVTPTEGWQHATDAMAKGMGQLLAEGKGSAEFRSLLAATDENTRRSLVAEAARYAVPGADLDTYARFIGEHLTGPPGDELILGRILSSGASPEAQFADARRLAGGIAETKAIDQIVGVNAKDIQGTRKWVDGLPAGAMRDAGLGAVSRVLTFGREDFAEAYETAKLIADPALREKTMHSVSMRWIDREPDSARTSLPPEWLHHLPQQ